MAEIMWKEDVPKGAGLSLNKQISSNIIYIYMMYVICVYIQISASIE